MIKHLQRRFIIIMMSSLLAVMIVIIGSINAVYIFRITGEADEKLKFLSVNDGKFPEFNKLPQPGKNASYGFHMDAETQFRLRYFTVKYDENGNMIFSDTNHIASATESEALEMSDRIYSSGNARGTYQNYRYLSVKKMYGTLVIFLDYREEQNDCLNVLVTSISIAAVGYAAVFVLISVLSKRAIQPTIKNIERQKRFITDAGHEIKTPLAIISANTEVLGYTVGENEWLASINNQVVRLNELIQSMLTLSKMDEENIKLAEKKFNISETVMSTAKQFLPLAKSKNRTLLLDIDPNISFCGDESSIRELISILVDNAVKYSSENGEIIVSLKKQGKNILIDISNTVDDGMCIDTEKLFERFYREDESRSGENRGYGLGLSIAQAIVEAQKGTIKALRKEKSVHFTVNL